MDQLKANVILPNGFGERVWRKGLAKGFGERVHAIAGPGTLTMTTQEEMSVETRTDGDFHIANAGKPSAPAAQKTQ